MDRLDDLEAQSVYIFREAFARLRRLELLWSLGKDSNVMIWIARKAFFGRVPFPVLHVDTGKKFPEMYALRNRYADERNLDLKIEDCRQTLPPRARHCQKHRSMLNAAAA
jgi:sulfate adenylyltransferase subunit 2